MIPIRRNLGLVLALTAGLACGCGHHASRVIDPDHASGANPARTASPSTQAPEADCPIPGYLGPVLTLQGPGFHHRYPTGGYTTSPSAEVPVYVRAGHAVTFRWSADASGSCTSVRSYRWTLDIGDVFDETPRIDEATDLAHWSAPSAGTSATVGPFAAGPDPRWFYVEVQDGQGYKSLGILRITVVPAHGPRDGGDEDHGRDLHRRGHH